jgi:hypothetical protein
MKERIKSVSHGISGLERVKIVLFWFCPAMKLYL